MTVNTTTTDSNDFGLEDLISLAKQDLSVRLQISIGTIELLEARSVTWPDASIGCPLPGMQYKQVPVDGALIRLVAGGQVYEYHSGGSRGLFLCEQPQTMQKDAPAQINIVPPTYIPPAE
ncbi:MAG: hypothetical protein JW954_05640 [Dehalococcoidaceae bacterium]|nr:hypothetical protein [Dehalococcoidaceae bacterium]